MARPQRHPRGRRGLGNRAIRMARHHRQPWTPRSRPATSSVRARRSGPRAVQVARNRRPILRQGGSTVAVRGRRSSCTSTIERRTRSFRRGGPVLAHLVELLDLIEPRQGYRPPSSASRVPRAKPSQHDEEPPRRHTQMLAIKDQQPQPTWRASLVPRTESRRLRVKIDALVTAGLQAVAAIGCSPAPSPARSVPSPSTASGWGGWTFVHREPTTHALTARTMPWPQAIQPSHPRIKATSILMRPSLTPVRSVSMPHIVHPSTARQEAEPRPNNTHDADGVGADQRAGPVPAADRGEDQPHAQEKKNMRHGSPPGRSELSVDHTHSSTACGGSATPAPSGAAPSAAAPSQAASSGAAPSAAAEDFTGVVVNVLTFNGPQIAEPLQRRAPDFEELTGAHVNVIAVPFRTSTRRPSPTRRPAPTATTRYVFDPQWMGDFVAPGYLEDLTRPRQRRPHARSGTTSARSSATSAPPTTARSTPSRWTATSTWSTTARTCWTRTASAAQTWDDYLAIAEKYNGQDLNGDGTPDYGSCISKKRSAQTYWWHHLDRRGFIQSQGTSQGVFFDTDDMKPLINNDAFKRRSTSTRRPATTARRTSSTTTSATPAACSPPAAAPCRWTGATSGRWPSTRDLEGRRTRSARSSCPARKQVLDRATGKLVPCDATTCPVRGRRRQPRAVRLLRRLVGRGQCGKTDARSRTRPTPSCPT